MCFRKLDDAARLIPLFHTMESNEPQSKRPRVDIAQETRSAAAEKIKKSVCTGCNQTFPSTQALSFHTKSRLAAHNKRRIDGEDYNKKCQILVCAFDKCCFTSNSFQDMGTHLAGGKHGTRRSLLLQKKVKMEDGVLYPSEVYVISRGVEGGGLGSSLSCPSCLRVMGSERSLNTHVTSGSCPGMAVWGCPHCGRQCTGRAALALHMASKHTLSPSLNLTGVFKGKLKDRKGKVAGGTDARPIEAFTFLAPKAVCMTAEEIFDKKQSENLDFLIERAQAGQGDYRLNINTSSLLLTTNSRKLELFRTQSKLQSFSITKEVSIVRGVIFTMVNKAASQAANASSGLSLHCIKSVTLTFGPASGLRGAGGDMDNGVDFPSSLTWANKVKIRGAVSLKVTEDDLIKDNSMQKKCFQHALLHNLFFNEFRMKTKVIYEERCERESHQVGEGLCTFCTKLWESEVSSKSVFAKTFLPWKDEVNWSGLEFPIGSDSYKTFCHNNPQIRLFIYRQVVQGGDVFQEFKSGVQEGAEDQVKNVHLIFTSRINLKENELESHFLSVNNLAKLCAKILNYGNKLTGKESKKKYEDGSVCEKCFRLFTFNTGESIGPQVKRMHTDFVNGNTDEKKSQLYLEHVSECGFSSLGTTSMPKKGTTLPFTNIKSLHDKPVTLFSDYETSHCSLSKVCPPCMGLYKEARGSRRAEILEGCLMNRHILMPGGARCEHCQQYLLESVEEATRRGVCDTSHQKLTFKNEFGQQTIYALCQGCLDEVCLNETINPPCCHSKTTPEAALEVISFSIVAIENYGRLVDDNGEAIIYPRILKEVTFVAAGDENVMLKFWQELQAFRPLISEKWRGTFPNISDCPLSKEEESFFEAQKDCYACQMPFDPPVIEHPVTGVDEEEDEDDRPAFRSRTKNRDHCHRSNIFRGEFISPTRATIA